jgi:putative peptidoglycan lipid II flippase
MRDEPRSLLGTVGSISSATFLSRILGLARDGVQSFYFGVSWITDAYVVAFRVPNLLRDLFAEGALSAAFVPTFTAERAHRGDEAAWRLTNRLITALLVVLGALTLAIAVGAPWILRLVAPGFEGPERELATTMTRIVSPFLLCVSLAAVAMGALNARGIFFLPALAPATFNVAAIASVVALTPWLASLGLNPGLSLAIGATVGGLVQLLVQFPAMRHAGFRFAPTLALGDPALVRIARLMLPAVVGLAATQTNILIDTMLATLYAGAPTALMLAFRLMQLPLGLFGVAIGTVNLARVSSDVTRGDHDSLRANLAAALRAGALLTLPAAAGLIALREPIVRVLFEHGAFDRQATQRTAQAVLCYALGLFAYTLTKTQVPTFYALGDTRRPVVASVSAVASKIGANFLLIALLPLAGLEPFLALALSTSLAAWVNFGVLGWSLHRRVGSLARHGVVGACCRMAALAALMGVVVAWLHGALGQWPAGGLLGEIVRLALAITAGVVLIAAGAPLVGVPEAAKLAARLRRRRPRGEQR